MTVTLAGRRDVTLDSFRRVAWHRESIQIAPAAIARMERCHAAFTALIDSLRSANPQAPIYGVTTGPGDSGSTVLTPEAEQRRPTRLWTAASFGAPLPERIVRGIVLARLTTLIEGNSGARAMVAQALAAMLDDPLPSVPADGNGGSGEILALGHLFFDLSERTVLEPKERMTLINGSPCAAALLADATLAGRGRLDLAEHVFALAIEALGAPVEAYSADLESLWDDQHETASLQRLRSLLGATTDHRLAYQAPVSFRIIPRVLGQARRAQAQAEEAAETALQSVTDNPVFIPPDERHPEGAILSNGGFHNAQATAALDALAFSWADLCQLAQRQSDKLFVHPATAAQLNDEWGLKPVHMVQTGWAEEARQLAQPSLLSLGSFGQNDVPAMSFMAWRKADAIGRYLDASLAVLAAVSMQALHEQQRHPSSALQTFADEVSTLFPPVEGVRRLGADFEALSRHFTARVFEAD